MKESYDIQLSFSQLNQLLSQHEKNAFKYLLENGIFCTTCNDYCQYGISNYKIFLDRFNDLKVVGECTLCGNEVTKIMEFGENESFFRKAVQFKNTNLVQV